MKWGQRAAVHSSAVHHHQASPTALPDWPWCFAGVTVVMMEGKTKVDSIYNSGTGWGTPREGPGHGSEKARATPAPGVGLGAHGSEGVGYGAASHAGGHAMPVGATHRGRPVQRQKDWHWPWHRVFEFVESWRGRANKAQGMFVYTMPI
mmetsp:Transcript_65562/g.109228  ORF Transcript_65562/g.109228 Transcript_65562/m.109228 type:complete len:149 (-) Transcript_65562:2725-3171(-)